jgi:hypothetical protein
MEIHRKVIPESVLSKGVQVGPEEPSEIAWPLVLSTKVINAVKESGLAIVGGDLYEKVGERFKPAYENWSIDIERGEKWEEYVKRTHLESLAYLESPWLKEDWWFVLVVIEKPDAGMLVRSYVR